MTKRRTLPAPKYSDVELGVRLDDIRQAAEVLLPAEQWLAIRRRARGYAIIRNRAASRRLDVSGASACHRPLFEDRP